MTIWRKLSVLGAIGLLIAVSTATINNGGSGAGGSGTVTSFSAGTLSPLFTTSVATATSTPALSFSLSNAGAGTLFGNPSGTAGAPSFTLTPVLGLAGTSVGTLGFQNATSGTVTLSPVTGALGTVTISLPAAAGTVAVSATAPITESAAGAVGCATCATTTNGGALSGTAPVAISAAGAISLSGTTGQVPNGATGAFTATPTLGAVGTAGTLTLSGVTSGTCALGVDATSVNHTIPCGVSLTGASGAATTINTTTANANLILAPNGTGAVVFNAGTAANPSIGDTALSTTGLYWPATSSFGVVFNGVEKERFIGGEVETIGTGGFTLAPSTLPATRDTGIGRSAAGVLTIDTSTIGNAAGLFRSGMPCAITSAVVLATTTTAICTWALPTGAQTWAYDCNLGWAVTAGTTPTIAFQINSVQTPTSETAYATILTTNTGTQTNGAVTSTASGAQTILTSPTLTTSATVFQAKVSGTIQASATAGNFSVSAIGVGASFAGTVAVGSECLLMGK